LKKQKESFVSVEKDTEDSGLEDLQDSIYKKFVEKTFIVINRINEIGLPQKKEQVQIVTFRSFNAVHFLAYVAKKERIEHVFIAVYSINHEAARLINDLINERFIESATILISNLRNKAHREKEQLTRDLFVENPNIDLFFLSSHAKIISMKTHENNFYTISGSGNLSYNSRVEQYVLDNDQNLYEFTGKWMAEARELLKGTNELIET
jgi:hypothetical protein